MAAETASTDRSVGFAVLFGLLCIVGALAAFIGGLIEYQIAAGWGFAVAMFAGGVVIAVIHLSG